MNRLLMLLALFVSCHAFDKPADAQPAAGAGPLEPCSRSWSESVDPQVVDDAWAYSVDQSPEFVDWLLAVAWVESHMDPGAKSPAGAIGLLQLTPQGALEASLECNLPKLVQPRQLDRLLDRRTSIVYGSCLLKKYLSESGGNWSAALMLYNGGYRQLTNYLGRRHLTAETQDYVRDVFYIRYECAPLGHAQGRSK